MKKIKMIAIVILLMALVPITQLITQPESASADTDTTQKIITVNGEGAIKVKPDIAYLSVGVETTNKNVETAQKDNTEKMNKLLTSLRSLGIKDEDIKTSNYSIYPDYKYNNTTGESVLNGYKVVNMTTVTIKNVNDAGKVIDTVTKNGANTINNISFGISNEKEVYLQALKAAVTDSKVKAKAVAETLNVKDVTTVKVTETSGNTSYPLYTETMSVAKDSTNISAGDLTVSASVSVDYKY